MGGISVRRENEEGSSRLRIARSRSCGGNVLVIFGGVRKTLS